MSKTLLLADDSVVIQKLVGLSFANEDVQLVTTDNGNDAITMARERKPDVVLADVVMPGRSGYDVCEAIKGDPELAHIPVILLTGTFEAFDEARAQAVGSNGHITKPFEAQALVDRVNELLRQAAAAPAAPASDDFELFDEGEAAPETAIGRDVTRAAPPPLSASQEPAGPRDPLAPDDGFSFGDADDALPALGDDDALADSLDAGAAPAAMPSEPTVAMMPDGADDDWLSTSEPPVRATAPKQSAPPAVPSGPAPPAAATMPPPLPTSEATPPLADAPPLPATPSRDEPLGQPDPSLTTIIMSEGDRSSDGVAYGESPPPVRSLDDAPTGRGLEAPSEPPADDRTLLADDLFGEPGAASDDSDSSFDFGGEALPGSSAAGGPGAPLGGPEADSFLDSDPFALPAERGARGGTPDWASRYDVSTSELIDDPAAHPGMSDGDGDLLEPESAGDEIELTDGLLGEPLDLGDARPTSTGPAPGAAPRVSPPVAPADPAAAPGPGATASPPPAESKPAPAMAASTPMPDITPVMRDRIHDTLERVAWEAFADLPETLIKQVLERVEAIAWEVIPQMAETLIKDEIRRMKGEDE